MGSLEGNTSNSLTLHDGQDTIAIDGVEGQARAAIIAKVAERIDQNPEGSLSLIRNWLEAADPKPEAAS